MIETLRDWLRGLIAAAICLAVLDALIPKGAVKGIGKVTAGLVLFLVMLQPWMQLDAAELELKFDTYRCRIDEQILAYQEDYCGQMEALIKAETGAYISETAAAMGVPCCAEVETVPIDGVPVPASVTLDTAYHEALSVWLTQEIGIAPQQQYWEVEP